MAQIQVVVRTGHKTNIAQGGSENKFYRTYEVDTIGSLNQWGSARNGMSGGQFSSTPSKHDASTQFMTKVNQGYVQVGAPVSFMVDGAKLVQQGGLNSKAGRTFLENQFHAADNGNIASSQIATGSTPKPSAAPDVVNVFDPVVALNSDILDAITLAATEPAKAMTERVMLEERVEELELGLRKIKSYMSTLDVMLEEAL